MRQVSVTTIAHVASRYGRSKIGAWEKATITGINGKEYITSDKILIERAKLILAAGKPVKILFKVTRMVSNNAQGEKVSSMEREINDFLPADLGGATGATSTRI